jgi:hypothetical protein
MIKFPLLDRTGSSPTLSVEWVVKSLQTVPVCGCFHAVTIKSVSEYVPDPEIDVTTTFGSILPMVAVPSTWYVPFETLDNF